MKNTTSVLFLTLSFFALLSCSKDNDETILEKKHYELSSIQWALQEGDGEEFFEIKTPERIVHNTGTDTIWITTKSYEGIEETSQFFIEKKALADLQEKDITVSVPENTSLLSTQYRISVGGRKAPFQTEKSILPPNTPVEDRFSVTPNCELRISSTFKMKKITATYKAVFTEKDGLDSYETKGKWEGTVIENSTCHTVYKDIK